jgi:hypothetical protein
MTKEDIVRMAQEAGWKNLKNFDSEMQEFILMGNFKDLEVFAALVASTEREACAKVCDEYAQNSSNPMNFAENCAKSIRARRQA